MPVEKGATPPPPWNLGRHHVVVARRVGEDEQISIEFYVDKQDVAQDWIARYLGELRDHMVKYNQQVVLAMRKQLKLIEDKIEERGVVLRKIEDQIEQHERQAQGVPKETPTVFEVN